MADYEWNEGIRKIPEIEWAETEKRDSGGNRYTAHYPVGYCTSPYWEWGVEWDFGLEVYQGEGDNTDGFMVVVRSAGEIVRAIRCVDFLALVRAVTLLEPVLRVSEAHAARAGDEEHHRHLIERQLDSDCADCGLIELSRRRYG